MQISPIGTTLNYGINFKSIKKQPTYDNKTQYLSLPHLNPVDRYGADKNQTPKEIKQGIKDFVSTSQRAQKCNQALSKRAAEVYNLANEVLNQAYKAQKYVSDIVFDIRPEKTLSFFEEGNEIDLDGRIVKRISKDHKDGSVTIDYLLPNGSVEKSVKVDRTGQWIEITEGATSAKDGSEKIGKRYVYNNYLGLLDHYEEDIEFLPDGTKKIGKYVDTSKMFFSGAMSYTYRQNIVISSEGSIRTSKNLYYEIEDSKPAKISFVYKEGQERFSQGNEYYTRCLGVTSQGGNTSGYYNEDVELSLDGTSRTTKSVSFANNFAPKYYREGVKISQNGDERITRCISYDDNSTSSYRQDIEYFADGSERTDKSFTFIMDEIVYYKENSQKDGTDSRVKKAIQKTNYGWKDVTKIVNGK